MQADPAPPPPGMTRRSFLGRLALAGGALALGGLTLQQSSGYAADPALAARLETLSGKQLVVLAALVARFQEGLPGADPPQEVAAWLDGYLGRQAPWVRQEVGALLALFEHGPPLLLGRLGRFTRLDPAGQDAYLARWAGARAGLLRQGWSGLKGLALMAIYRRPAALRAIGYDGGPLRFEAR